MLIKCELWAFVIHLTRLLVCFAEMSDYMDKVDRLKCLVLNMPPPNHDTLKFMCRHLKRWVGGEWNLMCLFFFVSPHLSADFYFFAICRVKSRPNEILPTFPDKKKTLKKTPEYNHKRGLFPSSSSGIFSARGSLARSADQDHTV